MITHEKIIEVVALKCKVDPSKIKSRDRHEPIAYARFLAMALELEITQENHSEVSLRYNRTKDMSIYAAAAIKDRSETCPEWRRVVNKVRTELDLPAL